jgi:4-amino-4-deoxy-L-arabinose transferase-like glycosyltransferase
VRWTKRAVGVVAIVLLLMFTVLAFVGVFSLIEWLIADVVVALVANLILKRVGSQTKQ